MYYNNKPSYDIVIGIDPDSDKDGIAILHTHTRKIEAMQTTFGKTLNTIQRMQIDAMAGGKRLMVYIEAGWLNKGNYHLTCHDTKAVIAAKGVDQGRNHQRGIDIADWCDFNKVPYQLIKPLPKRVKGIQLWKGNDGKISQSELERVVGTKLRTTDKNGRPCTLNQEGRDAVLIAWWHSGMPINFR